MTWIAPAVELREKTHCVRGHLYTPENTYTKDDGWRRCKECQRIDNREGQRRWRDRQRQRQCA